MDKKLKISIIGSRGYPYIYSGYETLVKELSERLVKKGHIVRVYCHSSLFKTKPKFVNGVELIYTPSIETKFLSQFINSFFSTLHFCFSSFEIGLYDKLLNEYYNIMSLHIPEEEFDYIRDSQRNWLKVRDKSLEYIFSLQNTGWFAYEDLPILDLYKNRVSELLILFDLYFFLIIVFI